MLQVDGAGDLPDEAMPDAMHISSFTPQAAQQPAPAGLAALTGAAVAPSGTAAAGLQIGQASAAAESAGPPAAAGPSEIAAASSAPASADLAAKVLVVDEPGPEPHKQHPGGGQQQEAGQGKAPPHSAAADSAAPPTAAAAAAELQQTLPCGMDDASTPTAPPTASAAAAELRQVLPLKMEASPAPTSRGAGQSMGNDAGPAGAATAKQGGLEPPPDVGMRPGAAVPATGHTAGQGTHQSAAAQRQPSPQAQPQPRSAAADPGSAVLPGASLVKQEASPVKQEPQHEAPSTSQRPEAAELSSLGAQQVEAVGAPGAGRQMLYPQPCEELDASDAEGTDKVSNRDKCPSYAPNEEWAVWQAEEAQLQGCMHHMQKVMTKSAEYRGRTAWQPVRCAAAVGQATQGQVGPLPPRQHPYMTGAAHSRSQGAATQP